MGRIHDALKKAEEERNRKRKREGSSTASAPVEPTEELPAVKQVDTAPPVERLSDPAPEPPPPFLEEPKAPSSRGKRRGLAAAFERAPEGAAPRQGGDPVGTAVLDRPDRRFHETLLSYYSPADHRTEQFRSLRTNILVLDPQPRIIAVASSVALEGATLTACNLAVTFGEEPDCRVLIVDCDLRSSKLREYFGIPQDMPGVSDILEGRCAARDVIVESGIRNVAVLSAGRRVVNPGALISGPHLEAMLKEVADQYERVIVLTPPVTEAHDASVIGRVVDAVVMVVKLGSTPRRCTERSIDTLTTSGVRVVGCVLTNSDRTIEAVAIDS